MFSEQPGAEAIFVNYRSLYTDQIEPPDMVNTTVGAHDDKSTDWEPNDMFQVAPPIPHQVPPDELVPTTRDYEENASAPKSA